VDRFSAAIRHRLEGKVPARVPCRGRRIRVRGRLAAARSCIGQAVQGIEDGSDFPLDRSPIDGDV